MHCKPTAGPAGAGDVRRRLRRQGVRQTSLPVLRSRPSPRRRERRLARRVPSDATSLALPERSHTGRGDVSLVPLGQGRAFLAFPKQKTAESLELALIDRLEAGGLLDAQRERYAAFRDILRRWRLDANLTFDERSIVVVERKASRR